MRQDENGTMFVLVSNNNISLVSCHGIVLNGQDATVDDAPLELQATVHREHDGAQSVRHRLRRRG